MTRVAPSDKAASCTIVLLGAWHELPPGHLSIHVGDALIKPCQVSGTALRILAIQSRLSWLLLGEGVTDDSLHAAVVSAWHVTPDIKVAVLGPPEDLARCERWLRRGANAYLSAEILPSRAVAILDVALELGMVVIDECFQKLGLAAQARMRLSTLRDEGLTQREQEVLQLLRLGLRNRDIASGLHLAESTVEFHVGNILSKLASTNRTEAAERAAALGL